MLPNTKSLRLSKYLYKGFLNIYVREFYSGSKTYLLQQNPNSGKWWSKFRNLYWETRNFPVEGRKLEYTGWIAKKNRVWKEYSKKALRIIGRGSGWKYWKRYV